MAVQAGVHYVYCARVKKVCTTRTCEPRKLRYGSMVSIAVAQGRLTDRFYAVFACVHESSSIDDASSCQDYSPDQRENLLF